MFRRRYRNVNEILLKSGRIDCFPRNLLLLNYNDNLYQVRNTGFSESRCFFLLLKFFTCDTCGDIDERFN